jgi:hypothetical protein
MPDVALSPLFFPATAWLQKVGKTMSKDAPESFDRTWQRLFDAVQRNPASASSAIVSSNRGRDWVFEAINSPVGHLVRSILEDAWLDSDSASAFKPRLKRIEQCLSLPGDLRRHAIALAAHHLDWLHGKDSEWTEKNLLSILDAHNDGDRDSLWAGFFWNSRISSPELYGRLKDGLLELAKHSTEYRDGHIQSLAFLVLLGWVSSRRNDGHAWVTDDELRDVLLKGGDEFRSQLLWDIGREFSIDEPAKRDEWTKLASEFFQKVWPRQKAVKNSRMTVQLCELLMSHQESFAALIDMVSPLLTTIRDEAGSHIHFRKGASEIVKAHPERFLHLLHTVLPDDVRLWPYGIGETLALIAEVDADLLADTRLLELLRKWNSR